MKWLEQWGQRVGEERVLSISVILSKHVVNLAKLNYNEGIVLTTYTTAYILQKEAQWATQTKRHPSWKIAQYIPPIPLVVRWYEADEKTAHAFFHAAQTYELDEGSHSHMQLMNLANWVSSTFLDTDTSEPLEDRLQTIVERWQNHLSNNQGTDTPPTNI